MMNNIILIDDDKVFSDSFVNITKGRNINVTVGHSLDDLKKYLPALAHKYAAVVLDIKCLLTDTQTIEDASFIPIALKYLDSTIPGFKRFLFTGDESEFDKFKTLYQDEKVFIKKAIDQEKLLNELEFCVQNAEPLRLKRENPLVFDVFDRNLLPSSKELKVLNILKKYNESNSINFTGIVGDIREIHEEVYKSINVRNTSVVPNNCLTSNGSPEFSKLFKHLLGNPIHRNGSYTPTSAVYQDSTVSGASKFIKNGCSEYLHASSATNYQISHYAIKALTNSLMEVIIWSKQY